MESPGDLGAVKGQSSLAPRSDIKEVGEKRSSDELREKHEVYPKRVKMRDVDDVIQCEEINYHDTKLLENKEPSDTFQSDGEMSRVTEVPLTLDLEASQLEIAGKSTSQVVPDVAPGPLDLNSDGCVAMNSACDTSPACAENSAKPSSLHRRHIKKPDTSCSSTFRVGLDLNAEDVASSVNQYPCYPCKNHNHSKAREFSECASSTGPFEEKDSMRLWKEMKQNGFLSSSHGSMSVQSSLLTPSHGIILVQNGFLSSSTGGIPPVPKQRGRKSKSDAQKKKMELAKKEHVDRFTKIAAPSGLLNELNPGIINNVRNRKQEYSIIEAIVKSDKCEKSLSRSSETSYMKSESKDIDNFKDSANMNDSGMHRLIHSYEDRPSNTLWVSTQRSGSSMQQNKSYPSMSDERSADGDSSMVVCADSALALKLSSSNKASEYGCALSNEESTNFPSAPSLSVKAASIASQWLELLRQDIKGRLSALRRSKKRVRAVINIELPFLISKEFSFFQENDPSVVNNCVDGFSHNATARMHRERWNTLFGQMDKALHEEEMQLESWLNQVKEMQLHCDQGLQYIHFNAGYGFQQPNTAEQDLRFGKVDSSEKELSIRAAAASIYSTCNFLASKENVSCC